MTDIPPVRAMQGETTAPTSLHLALPEHLLPGDTTAARLRQAEHMGIAGVEFSATGLGERVDEICAVLKDSAVQAATVRLGTDYNFISADEPTRQRALDAVRHAMTDAVDIGASGVVLVPHTGDSLGLPDLMPLKAPIQIAVELMVLHLRTLSDLAYVFGVKLYLQPLNPYESAFLNRLEQGVELLRRIKFSRHVMLAADTYHATTSEGNPLHALEDCSKSIGHVYLSENNGKLPGNGSVDFAAVRQHLGDSASGWAVMRQHTALQDSPTARDLRNALAHLRKCGF